MIPACPINGSKRLVSALLILGMSLTTGCAGRYVPPSGGSTATVTFLTTARTLPADVLIFKSRKCDGVQSIGKTVNDRNNPDKKPLTASVRAGEEVILTYRIMTDRYTCYVTSVLTPKDGEAYSFLFDDDYAGRQCAVKVGRYSKVKRTLEPASELSDTPPKCTF